uniref:Alkylated DNA repair protein AlkB homologue 8 N-terminal domain-containing protein n=1 Tax=Oreochromis aureus TaxID=47969 RepID=A0AAZ1WWY5_OREAU
MMPGQPPPAERRQDQGAGGGLQKESAQRLQAHYHQWSSSGEGAVLQVSWCPHLLRPDMVCPHSGPDQKARQRLYHLRQLRKFRVSPKILRILYTGAVESILTQNITSWFGNSCVKDQKALQRVIHTAERCCRIALPPLQDTYTRSCQTRAAQILKDPSHPGNKLFQLLQSGRRFRIIRARTERLKRSFYPQAIRALNTHTPALSHHL